MGKFAKSVPPKTKSAMKALFVFGEKKVAKRPETK